MYKKLRKTIKASKKKYQVTYKGGPIMITLNISMETLKIRRA